MKPRRPKAVRINGRSWRLRFRKPNEMAGNLGLTHYSLGAIDIASGQDDFDTRDTVLHETFHAVLAQQGRTSFGNEEEEQYVRALATGLMGVLQDNPEFAQWLIHPIHRNESIPNGN